MNAAAPAPLVMRRQWLAWGFVVLMLALTVLFAALGWWQLNRLGEKDALTATVAERLNLEPRPLPPVAEWVGFDAEVFNYRPVRLSGTFAPDQSVLVFTSLSDPKGRYGGPGYWVMSPLVLDGGGVVWVNRGFVPDSRAQAFAAGGPATEGAVTLTGIARAPEEAGSFTPGPDAAKRVEWVRDPVRLSALADPALVPTAPVYVDLPAGEAGALPQGGETVVSFPNNHLGYAITWFGFAILTPILLVVWLFRQRQPQSLQ